jgi:hypothetical protein
VHSYLQVNDGVEKISSELSDWAARDKIAASRLAKLDRLTSRGPDGGVSWSPGRSRMLLEDVSHRGASAAPKFVEGGLGQLGLAIRALEEQLRSICLESAADRQTHQELMQRLEEVRRWQLACCCRTGARIAVGRAVRR